MSLVQEREQHELPIMSSNHQALLNVFLIAKQRINMSYKMKFYFSLKYSSPKRFYKSNNCLFLLTFRFDFAGQ